MTSNHDAVIAAQTLSVRARAGAVRLVQQTGWGFLGSCLSAADIISTIVSLWDIGPEAGIDRIVLSKGHAAPLLYAALLDDQALRDSRYAELGDPLQGHPRRGEIPQVHTTTGSLGQGIPHAVGEFMAHRRIVRAARLAIVVGDGEIESGIALEALGLIADLSLTGIVVVVDHNRRQAAKRPSEAALRAIQSTLPGSTTLDGHDIEALVACLNGVDAETPAKLIVCNTIPGAGLDDPEFIRGRMGYIPPLDQLTSILCEQQGDFI